MNFGVLCCRHDSVALTIADVDLVTLHDPAFIPSIVANSLNLREQRACDQPCFLRVRSERLFTVPPLAFPDEPASDAPALSMSDLIGCQAVCLFFALAQAADPDFGLTSANAPTITQIYRRRDGLPGFRCVG